ncbi:hypothetical protein [Aliidiomarina quisquiliarum]|uniref:hypothetical protein n=1 Tax=Aliidiomarina quisquiliarum TaxID=2938947 RepID=UPI00208E5E9F|nr:hypothetical protein [Aliidiomarina quisquiliarum]MCO4319984.1 hypothetical protein [Aliidiomarina quisquiliarum]
MLEQIKQLIERGNLNAVNLKISLENGEPVVQMSVQTDGVHASVLSKGSQDTEEARQALLTLRANLARPIIFKGSDFDSELAKAIPVLCGSYAKALENVDALSIAAKLDSASEKAGAATQKAQAKQPAKAKAKETKATKASKDEPAASSQADAKKDAVSETSRTVDTKTNDTTAPAPTKDAAAISGQFDFDSL